MNFLFILCSQCLLTHKLIVWCHEFGVVTFNGFIDLISLFLLFYELSELLFLYDVDSMLVFLTWKITSAKDIINSSAFIF